MDMSLPLGVRTNNPLNLEKPDPRTYTWRGEVVDAPGRFCSFEKPEFGIRAAHRNLQTGEKRDGENTVREIINSWAPPHENRTDKYIDFVASYAALDPDQEIDIYEYEVIRPLMEGMVIQENGWPKDRKRWYSDEVWETGLRMAGVTRKPKKAVQQRTTIGNTSQTVGFAATVAGTLAQAGIEMPPGVQEMLAVATAGVEPSTLALVGFLVWLGGTVLVQYARQDDEKKGRR